MAEPSPQPERSSLPHSLARNIFVGRQPEMAELTAALEDVLSGQGRLFMVVGEPGIGKTRTTQELATLALAKGVRILWGRCYEQEGAPPYWPWVQIMRAYVQQAGAEQLTAEMGAGAAGIAEIIPEIRGKLTDLETPPALEPDQARFRLFDSITTFLKNASQNQPLMLVLDDLHWADRSSLLLLEFLARELGESRLLLVGCYRDTELSQQPLLAETLAQLSREPTFRRQVLRGLGQDELGRFIEATTGVQPSPELTDELYAHTEGNPFFMTEVIRLMSESGELAASRIGTPEGLRIPEGVREVIGQRLNRLSGQCNEVLTTASIIGREFDFRLLKILSGEMSEGQLLKVVEEAVSFHLIEDVPGQMDRYQFVHALFQQTLAEEVTTSRKVRLHARIGESLESLYGDDTEAHVAGLAHHFGEAAAVLGTEKLVRYSLLAGARALAACAWEEASALFQRGLEAKEGQSTDAEIAALMFGLGRAQVATFPRHRSYEVVNTMRPAFDYYVATGDNPRALAIAEVPFGTRRGSTGITSILEESLTLVPSGSLQEARLLVGHADALTSEHGNYEGAVKALAQAQAIAQRENDVDLEAKVLAKAAGVHLSNLHPRETLENCLRALELDRRAHYALLGVGSPHFQAVAALVALGDIGGARPHAVALLAEAENHGGAGLAPAFRANEVLAHLEGDWQSAVEFSDRGLEVDQRDTRLLNNRAMLEYQRGEFDQGDAYLERLLETMRLSPPGPLLEYSVVPLVIGVAARVTGRIDRLDVAEAAAQTVLSSPSVVPLFAQHARIGLALLAVQQGDKKVAAEQYAALTDGPSHISPIDLMCPDGVLGLLAQTMGNLDKAMAHFEGALAFCRRAGYRPELAWICYDLSDALLQRCNPGDRSKADSLLKESLAISTELGMRPLAERVTDRLDRIQAQPERSPAYPAGLSEREVEVLGLLASGKSNAVIAAELVLSVRTVERHISNIYGKTNSHGRADATAFAFTHGLMSSI